MSYEFNTRQGKGRLPWGDSLKVLRSAFAPLLILSQNVPIVVLAPLLVVWFGFGWAPKIILLTLVCFFPVAIATLDGLARADRNMVGYMRMAGASRWQTFVKLELPWSLPVMFSGLKVSAAYSILGAVIAVLSLFMFACVALLDGVWSAGITTGDKRRTSMSSEQTTSGSASVKLELRSIGKMYRIGVMERKFYGIFM
jgi:hypothetical protein